MEMLKPGKFIMAETLTNDRYPLSSINGGKINISVCQDPITCGLISLEKEDETQNVCDVDAVDKKMWFHNPLIPMRVSLFLWCGAARIPGLFLSVFMKQRGLSLVQFSSVFSFTFVFQFFFAAVSGIVVDKIGNSKPVLMFLLLSSLSTIICMLLVPSISPKPGVEYNLICLDNFGIIRKKLSYSNSSCSEINNEKIQFEELYLRFGESFNSNIIEVFSVCDNSNHGDETFNLNHCFLRDLTDMIKTDLNCSVECLNISENGRLVSDTTLVTIYSILIILFYSFWSTTYRLFDITVMTLSKENNSDFGTERFVELIGELFSAILISFVLDAIDSTGSKNYYDYVYYISASVMFTAFLSVLSVEAKINSPGRNLTKKAFRLIQNIQVMAFLGVVFILGNNFCFNMNFHLWFLEYLNAPKVLFGLHAVSFSLYGMPLLLTSKWWLRKLGPPKIFVLSLLCYSISGFCYSLIYDPWLSLAIEWTTAFSFHLLWVSVVVHSHNIAPEGLVATVNAVSGVIHFGIGRSTGVVGGGLLMNALGPRKTYRIFATATLVAAVLYSIFLYRRHVSAVRVCNLEGAEGDKRRNFSSDDAQQAV